MKELEAKYLLTPGRQPEKAFRRTLQELVWAGCMARPQGTRAIADVYYDTADRRLQRAGWSLRRRSQKQEHTFTCKQLQSAHDNLFERRELEQTAMHQEPVIEKLGEGPVTDLIRRFVPSESTLLPIFSLKNQRIAYNISHLDYPRAKIELVLDKVRIHAQADLDFVEFEAELKHGPTMMLRDVVDVLNVQPMLVRSRVSKYQRGLQATGCPPAALLRKAGTPLTPDHHWRDLGLRHLNRQFRTLSAFEPLAYEAIHPEGVHQMRVATRRLRAALKTFRHDLPAEVTPAIEQEVRWLAAVLGEVRDLDVQLGHLIDYRDWLPKEDRPALQAYQQHLQIDHRDAHQQLIAILDGERYAELTHRFTSFLDSDSRPTGDGSNASIDSVAASFMPRRLKSIRREGRRINKHSPDEALHQLRIRIKRLRYQLEFLAEPYGAPLARATRHLRRLQNTLGAHQDACVARATLGDYRERHASGRYQKRTFNRLIRLEEARAREARATFRASWRKFDPHLGRLHRLFKAKR